MSAHLAILARAKLIIGERHSRSTIYRANLDRFRQITLFLNPGVSGALHTSVNLISWMYG